MKQIGAPAPRRITGLITSLIGLLLASSVHAGVAVPTPEVRQSAWQCRAAHGADWSCQRQSKGPFDFTLEQVTRPSVPQSNRNPMSWPKEAYTIQLIAVSKPESLDLLRQQDPRLLRATEVKVEIKQRPLHLLLWGQYPDRKTAEQALQRFGLSDIKGLTPWIRPMENLQKLQPSLIAGQP